MSDLLYFTGDPVFQPGSPASREEAARETESPVFDYKLIQIGRIYKLFDSPHGVTNTNHLCSEQCDCSIHFKSNSENILRSAYFAEIARFLDHRV